MLTNVMLLKKACTSNSFVALPRLHATAVDCAHELINGESGIKGEAGQKSSKLINGEYLIRLASVAKNRIIDKHRVPFIRNSRVLKRKKYSWSRKIIKFSVLLVPAGSPYFLKSHLKLNFLK